MNYFHNPLLLPSIRQHCSLSLLSLHFFSCFLVLVCNNNNDDSTSFLLQIETKTEKKKDQDINAKALQASDSKAESRFPSAVELVCAR